MQTLFINIGQLIGIHERSKPLRGLELATLPTIKNAFLLVENEAIKAFGSMSELELYVHSNPNEVIDAGGKVLMPAWCDSHTHIVFAGTRESEFVDKIRGLSYAEIAAKGGGILNSARKLTEADEDELYAAALTRLKDLKRLGTGAIEIKSGYGLSTEAELKMLRVIARLKASAGIPVKATFLGAHTFPLEYKDNHKGYIDKIIHEMLPAIAAEKLADYIDVFCESGFFSPDEMIAICEAGAIYGLRPKLHVNQLNSIGGIEAGIGLKAVSMDHLETMTEKDIALTGMYDGCATLLPTAAFFLRMQYQPARALIDANAAVTLASDFNPGSSPSGNMNFVAALACIQMKMLPEEAINAGTFNGACAMELQQQVGSIAIGKKANLILAKAIPSYTYLFYNFAHNNIESVMLNGQWVG